MKFIKCPSLCLVIQSEVKGLKVFAEAASQGLLLFLADLTLPPVRLVWNIKDGFTCQNLPAERAQRSHNRISLPTPPPTTTFLSCHSITQRRRANSSDFTHTIFSCPECHLCHSIKIIPILSDQLRSYLILKPSNPIYFSEQHGNIYWYLREATWHRRMRADPVSRNIRDNSIPSSAPCYLGLEQMIPSLNLDVLSYEMQNKVL